MPSTLQRKIAILKNAAVAGKVHAFEEFESNVPYMYLDVAGQVTVGIGHAILSEEAACQLPFKSADGTPASREVIVAAFKKIHSGRQAQRALVAARRGELDLAVACADDASSMIKSPSSVPTPCMELFEGPAEAYLAGWQRALDEQREPGHVADGARRILATFRSWARLFPIGAPSALLLEGRVRRLEGGLRLLE